MKYSKTFLTTFSRSQKDTTIYVFMAISIFLISCLYLYTMYLLDEKTIDVDYDIPHKEYLEKNGVCICKKAIGLGTITALKGACAAKRYTDAKNILLRDENLLRFIQEATGSPHYVFQDYIWVIQKSSVHTCHRDNNGDFFNPGQKHPSYTMLVYLEDMDRCLSVIPKSHTHVDSYFTNFNGGLHTVLCNQGDAILFNANLIHAGCINEKDDHLRIQLKVSHRDDIPKLAYYQNYNKVLNESNSIPRYIRKLQKHISCMFPGVSNYTQQENISSARGSDNGAKIGYGQKLFSYLFYGNENYYDLKNIG